MSGSSNSPGGTDERELLRVLYVEDSKTDALMVESMLAHSHVIDFDVTVASTLRESLSMLAKEPYDVILADLTLPDSEGISTFTAVRDSAPGLPVIVLTASGRDLTLGRRTVSEGAADFLDKSWIDGERLAQLLLFAVERQRARPETRLADPLTQLPTRELFVDRLRQALLRSQTEGRPVAVAAVGLFTDNGEPGQEIVAAAAQRLLGALRPKDSLARTGSSEFAAMAEGIVRPVNAERAAHRMLGALAGGTTGEHFRAGIGLILGRSSSDPESLLRSAQSALRHVRLSGMPGLRWAESR